MLLSVGELSVRKNHSVVINALSQLNNRNIKYFICGKGKLKNELELLCQKLGVEEQVFLLGYRTDISELCQCADLYVFPSLQEGLPVALMEAIACKMPVICSNIRGNIDLIKNQDYLFNPMDVDAICKCMSYALASDNSHVVEENYLTLQQYDMCSVSRYMCNEYERMLI